MKSFLKIFYNKYVIAIAIFLAVMLFFDQNDWFTQMDRKDQLKEANNNVDFLKEEIESMSEELHQIKNDPEVASKYAREKYYHKKDDEDLFIITKDTVIVTPEK